MIAPKSREMRLRNTAQRQGLSLCKCRRRDPRALGFGTYGLYNSNNVLEAGDTNTGYGLTLDDVEQALTGKQLVA